MVWCKLRYLQFDIFVKCFNVYNFLANVKNNTFSDHLCTQLQRGALLEQRQSININLETNSIYCLHHWDLMKLSLSKRMPKCKYSPPFMFLTLASIFPVFFCQNVCIIISQNVTAVYLCTLYPSSETMSNKCINLFEIRFIFCSFLYNLVSMQYILCFINAIQFNGKPMWAWWGPSQGS